MDENHETQPNNVGKQRIFSNENGDFQSAVAWANTHKEPIPSQSDDVQIFRARQSIKKESRKYLAGKKRAPPIRQYSPEEIRSLNNPDFRNAHTFQDIARILSTSQQQGIQGSHRFYSVQEISQQIFDYQAGMTNLSKITNSGGLRDALRRATLHEQKTAKGGGVKGALQKFLSIFSK